MKGLRYLGAVLVLVGFQVTPGIASPVHKSPPSLLKKGVSHNGICASNNQKCDQGFCCKQSGYCGTTADYCQPESCQPGWGECWDPDTTSSAAPMAMPPSPTSLGPNIAASEQVSCSMESSISPSVVQVSNNEITTTTTGATIQVPESNSALSKTTLGLAKGLSATIARVTTTVDITHDVTATVVTTVEATSSSNSTSWCSVHYGGVCPGHPSTTTTANFTDVIIVTAAGLQSKRLMPDGLNTRSVRIHHGTHLLLMTRELTGL